MIVYWWFLQINVCVSKKLNILSLSVEAPVELTSSLQDVVISKLHSVAEFRLKLSRPDCRITWLSGTKKLSDGPKHSVGMDDLQPYLKVKDVMGADEGKYTVNVDNKSSTAQLYVQGKSRLLSFLSALDLYFFILQVGYELLLTVVIAIKF